jgi:hypothetical protein
MGKNFDFDFFTSDELENQHKVLVSPESGEGDLSFVDCRRDRGSCNGGDFYTTSESQTPPTQGQPSLNEICK